MPSFVALGNRYEVTLHALSDLGEEQPIAAAARKRARRATAAGRGPGGVDAAAMVRSVNASPVMKTRVDDPMDLAVVQSPTSTRGRRMAAAASPTGAGLLLATETVIGEGLRQADLAAAKSYGASVLEEGLDGKILLKVDSVARAFGLVELLRAREVGSVSPNFLRRVERLAPSTPTTAWAHAKIGVPAAWTITKGSSSIKIAVLDEGVDTTHPSLRSAVVAERDFIGGNSTAMPDGDDAHGTACAGIVLSRSSTFPGVAPRCSLIAVRIAMGDGTPNGWVFDDFATADAIDWSWRQGADVLSNSWGGGAPSDAISRAFARARTQGRNGRGTVVIIAAGNAQRPIDFPGNLPGYVTIGASNHKDERKTRTSADGENWWGSNYGATMRLLAPGVFIWTTDISGTAGYDATNFTKTFNGTSAATPHVAGAVGLMLSVAPQLSASTIRNLLGKSAKRIAGQTGWTPQLGWGRLDVGKAVTMAKASASPAGAKARKKPSRKKARKKR
jgi:subtilisin family serine protease